MKIRMETVNYCFDVLDLMSQNKIHFLEGIRLLNSKVREIDPMFNQNFTKVIVAFESDTDFYPLGEVRKLWNKQSLLKQDERYLDNYKRGKKQLHEGLEELKEYLILNSEKQ